MSRHHRYRVDRERLLRTLTFWLRPEFLLRVVSRFQKVAGFDRAIALASGALTAMIPLAISALGQTDDAIDALQRAHAEQDSTIAQSTWTRDLPEFEATRGFRQSSVRCASQPLVAETAWTPGEPEQDHAAVRRRERRWRHGQEELS